MLFDTLVANCEYEKTEKWLADLEKVNDGVLPSLSQSSPFPARKRVVGRPAKEPKIAELAMQTVSSRI